MALAAVRSKSVGGSAVVYSLFIVANIVREGCVRYFFCYAVLFVLSFLWSSRWGRESWLLYFRCLLGVMSLYYSLPGA